MLVELAADPRKAGVPVGRRVKDRTGGLTTETSAPFCRLVAYDEYEEPLNKVFRQAATIPDEDQIAFDLNDLITIEEVATVLHVRRQWLIRKVGKYPFVKRLSRKKYVCSRLRLIQWLASGSKSAGRS
jgi:hypothetical protein